MKYWLLKSEPDCYSIDHLKKDKKTGWSGVRNYQARNFMRDEMKIGDGVLYYHSNAEPSGVAGIAKVASESYPDHTAFNSLDDHFDAKSTPEKPLWFMVDVEFVKTFPKFVPLSDLRDNPKLAGMEILKKGSRLSVTPVSKEHFEMIKKMGGV